MKIGYPCVNNSLGCTSSSNFRLSNYSDSRFVGACKSNLECLRNILKWNISHDIFFFRISSGIIPFASHHICKFDWQSYFKKEFKEIGDLIKSNSIRISMHPDQFVLINSPSAEIVKKSISELIYHAQVLDLLGLDKSAKIQIHVGGVYGDKDLAMERFIKNYLKLPEIVKQRLVIENDDRLYSLKDCLFISSRVGIPVLFDFFHHKILNNGETISQSIKLVSKTWKKGDGVLMSDYSTQRIASRVGAHTESIDLNDFIETLKKAKKACTDLDIMLEIKNKERSCILAINTIKEDSYLNKYLIHL